MAPPPKDSERIAEAKRIAAKSPTDAESVYKDVLAKGPGSSQTALNDFEAALVGLGEVYRDTKNVSKLSDLIKDTRSTLSSFAKAKTAKLGE